MIDRRLLVSSILGAVTVVAIYYGILLFVVIPNQQSADATNTPKPLVTLPPPADTMLPYLYPTPTIASSPPDMATSGPTVIYVVVTATDAPRPPSVPTYIIITATPVLLIPSPVTPPCPCDRNRYNCGHWDNKVDMLACYDYCMGLGLGDVHDLDGDNDGLPCEHLR